MADLMEETTFIKETKTGCGITPVNWIFRRVVGQFGMGIAGELRGNGVGGVNKEQRVQMIRAGLLRMRGNYFVGSCARKEKREIRRRYFRNYIHLCVGEHVKEMPQDWITTSDKGRDPIALRTARTGRKTALTRIAERWDERKQFAAPRNRD